MKNLFYRILLVILGVGVIIFGVYTMYRPALTLVATATIYGAVLLVTSLVTIVEFAFTSQKKEEMSGAVLAMSILDLMLGILIMFNLGAATLSIPIIVSFWLISRGIIGFIIAIDLRKIEGAHWIVMLTLSILTIIAGYLGLTHPVITALGTSTIISLQFIVVGVMIVVQAFARKLSEDDKNSEETEETDETIVTENTQNTSKQNDVTDKNEEEE